MNAQTQIRKRDGRVVSFDQEKIATAIFKAARSVGGSDFELARQIAAEVTPSVITKNSDGIPSVEEVQDAVERILIKAGHAKTAKAYILYRERHSELRRLRTAILDGKETSIKLSANSLTVLRERYLKKDMNGKLIETPEQLFRRVARNISQADEFYDQDARETEEIFYQRLANCDFMPNSPTLMNAGNELQQLSACYVLPIGDSIEDIFDALKYQAIIHKSGGGTGFSFSRLRPKNDMVKSTRGVSSGPVSFMKIFDAATNEVKQGGKRRGANMGILRVDHPDILDFITLKEDNKTLQNFNISVGITDRFMEALYNNTDHELLSPRTKEVMQKIPARQLWDLLVMMAWKTGDPGMVFLDRINRSRANPTPALGEIESTNPCGEQPLLPYEPCNLGSINLAKFVKGKDIQWDALRECVHDCIHFLDNVIDMNRYPLPQIERMAKGNRRIGLGIMGFADLLFALGIKYDSEEGIAKGREVMQFISTESDRAAMKLAHIRGVFPNFDISIYKGGMPLRNCTRTTIAPTGTISMIADCSSGIEPLFALVFVKRVMDGKELLYVNEHFERVAHEKGFYSEALMQRIADQGSIADIEDIPADVREVFRVAFDISPYWHVRMQAVFQEFTDNAVSKTINFPNSASTTEVEEAYKLAWEMGCKGITIYRDGSKGEQVLNVRVSDNLKKSRKADEKKVAPVPLTGGGSDACPECGHGLHFAEGCNKCHSCGYSACSSR